MRETLGTGYFRRMTAEIAPRYAAPGPKKSLVDSAIRPLTGPIRRAADRNADLSN